MPTNDQLIDQFWVFSQVNRNLKSFLDTLRSFTIHPPTTIILKSTITVSTVKCWVILPIWTAINRTLWMPSWSCSKKDPVNKVEIGQIKKFLRFSSRNSFNCKIWIWSINFQFRRVFLWRVKHFISLNLSRLFMIYKSLISKVDSKFKRQQYKLYIRMILIGGQFIRWR